jgi:steroid 5-alpha reductase family enzyme
MLRAFAWIVLAYLIAGGVAIATGQLLLLDHLAFGPPAAWNPIAIAAAADAAATVAIFCFSAAFRNSSFYDAYWSVAPPALLAYWVLSAGELEIDILRRSACLTLVAVWAARLTYNWARGWQGLTHEDWRYLDLQEKAGPLYWPLSFVGIHLIPTIVVFLGCLPLYTVVAVGTRPFGALDVVALLVVGTAVALEAAADEQLRAFVSTRRNSSDLLSSGLWAFSRHPNYFGEILFWWGLFLFGLAADPTSWWTGIGALSITILFRVVSLPMIETRMLANKPEYKTQVDRTNLLVPWLPRGR